MAVAISFQGFACGQDSKDNGLSHSSQLLTGQVER
jgi:hypothetical protein